MGNKNVANQKAASRRPIILTFVRHYLPGYKFGGQTRSVANIVTHLGGEFDFRIICLNRDFRESAPYSGIEPGVWSSIGNAKVFYTHSISPALLLRLTRGVNFDAIYLNSFFDPLFSLLPTVICRGGLIRKVPIILAPRGEFSAGALEQKAAKKRAFLAFAKAIGYARDFLWHVSTEREAMDVQAHFKTATCEIAPNLPARVDTGLGKAVHKHPRSLRVVFVSRIARMKNLTQAIRIINSLPDEIVFDIFGPVDDSLYWRECQSLILEAPPNVSIRYNGPLAHASVRETLAGYHVFLLPTLGENFGHAIFEALSAGVPVVISDRTPWMGLAATNVGFDIPLDDQDRFVAALLHYQSMSNDEYQCTRLKAIRYIQKWVAESDMVARNRALFHMAVGKRV